MPAIGRVSDFRNACIIMCSEKNDKGTIAIISFIESAGGQRLLRNL